jgi:hypothetical protein
MGEYFIKKSLVFILFVCSLNCYSQSKKQILVRFHVMTNPMDSDFQCGCPLIDSSGRIPIGFPLDSVKIAVYAMLKDTVLGPGDTTYWKLGGKLMHTCFTDTLGNCKNFILPYKDGSYTFWCIKEGYDTAVETYYLTGHRKKDERQLNCFWATSFRGQALFQNKKYYNCIQLRKKKKKGVRLIPYTPK